VSDCRRAIELDSKLIKAHFFMGQALTELENYDEAIKGLKIGRLAVAAAAARISIYNC